MSQTGFKFVEYTPEALQAAIEQALDAFEKPESWIARMRRGMAKDFSWDTSAAEYQRRLDQSAVAIAKHARYRDHDAQNAKYQADHRE